MNRSSLTVFLFAFLLLVSTGVSQLNVDDGVPETESQYMTDVAFIDNPLFVLQGTETDFYNLTLEGQEIDGPLNYSTQGFISTSGAAKESRATVWNMNKSNNNKHEIDLVENTSDVTGRLGNNTLGADVQSVSTHYWLNGSLDGRENASVFGWNNSEALFKMNLTSGIGNYWINVTTDNGTAFGANRGAAPFQQDVSTPRINDFSLTGFQKINGTVGNATDPAETQVENIEIRLRRKANTYPSRLPYATAPPEKTTLTDSNGYYEFTGVEAGQTYMIDVMNDSVVREEYFGAINSKGGITTNVSNPNKAWNNDFNVTDETGTVKAKLIGNSAFRYGFLTDRWQTEANQTFLNTDVNSGEVNELTVAAGNHTLIAGKFGFSGGTPSILTDERDIEVTEGGTVGPFEIGFPSTVTLSGTVEDQSGNSVENAQVIARNETEGGVPQVDITDGNGDYTLEVKNRTGYNLTVRPPFDSTYGSNSTTVQMTGSETQNLVVDEGSFIEGYVNESGTGIEGAVVEAWNGSKRSYGRAETDSTGYYKVGGLEDSTGYDVFVDTPPGYPGNETQIAISGGNATENFDLSQENYDLNGTIKNATDSTLDATVEVDSLDSGFSDSKTTSSGDYSFQGLESGFYKLEVSPDDDSYRDSKDFVSLQGDKDINFTLSQRGSISGYVNDNANSNPVSNVRVFAYNYSENSFDTDETDASGQYELDVSSVGHKVELRPESNYKFNDTSFSASDFGGEKNFTVASGQFLDGEVKDPGTKNLSGSITVYNKSEGLSRYQEFSDGDYNVTGLNDTVGYNVFVSTDDSDYGNNRTTVESSLGTQDFNFSKETGPELWITVEAVGGGTLEDAKVEVDGEVEKTDSSGLAKFESREDNINVTARAGKDNYNYTEREINVSSTVETSFGSNTIDIQNETLNIENIRGNLVEVDINVTDTSGKEISGARVGARSNTTGRIATDITDAEGSGTLEEIRPGPDINYTTAVSANGNLDAANLTFQKGNSGTDSLGSNFDLEWEVPS